ncbi:hypothetical protein EMMF5_002345 [Cystobasidiomycetes sp. EMM_F5]
MDQDRMTTFNDITKGGQTFNTATTPYISFRQLQRDERLRSWRERDDKPAILIAILQGDAQEKVITYHQRNKTYREIWKPHPFYSAFWESSHGRHAEVVKPQSAPPGQQQIATSINSRDALPMLMDHDVRALLPFARGPRATPAAYRSLAEAMQQ